MMTQGQISTLFSRPAQARDVDASRGPVAFIGSALIALAVAGAAATFAPTLAQSGQSGYNASGVAMCLSDLLVLVGVIALYRSAAVRPGRLKNAGFVLAVAGSAGIVVAEAILRINFDTGTAVFGVVGPMQALGLILIGIGAIRTKAWRGWHRYVLLLMGLYVPAVLIPALAASDGQNLLALGGYHAIVLLVGIAFWQETRRGRG